MLESMQIMCEGEISLLTGFLTSPVCTYNLF